MDKKDKQKPRAEKNEEDPSGGSSESSSQGAKGKGKDTTMLERLRSSGEKMSEALATRVVSLPSSSQSPKSNQGAGSASVGVSEALQQTSRMRPMQNDNGQGLGIFKEHQEPNRSSHAFDELIGTQEPQLPDGQTRARLPNVGVGDFAVADGSAVVDLLSQPYHPDMEPTQKERDQSDRITPEAASKLRETLFGSQSHQPAWEDLLNFTPQFVASPGAGGQGAELYMGTTDPMAARDAWLTQWHDVLSRYTDDVWGDLGPLAAEAKREVKDLASSGPFDGQGSYDARLGGALGRLRMILGHVRGSV